ncbi:MAG: acyl-CoA dehydrogenase family protein [Reyranellaceae bacterium]
MDFAYSDRTKGLIEKVEKFMDDVIYPAEHVFHEQLDSQKDRWQMPPVMEELKAEAKKRGLWNMFLPPERDGNTHGTMGLTNLEYAPICEILGRSHIASEAMNCSAPDTGNMEVLARYGTEEQKEKWLKPLLNGEIRSCFAMTEPAVASSDAKNIGSRIERDGNDYVINGRKWWSSGMGDPRCKIVIFMGKTDPKAPAYQQQSMILVPADAPGIKIERMLHVFGYDDAPHGHAEVSYTNVRVPKENMILGEGRGFEIAQGRLGPGRIHHCMRSIGAAERALELAIKRAKSRTAFGQSLAEMGVTKHWIAESRMEIEQARLLVLKAAWMMDKVGNKTARKEIAMIKVVVPNMSTRVIDRCLQIHGGGGVSQAFPLASMYAHQRTLRLADGPDEVHRDQVGRLEISRWN